MSDQSLMLREANHSPEVVAHLLQNQSANLDTIGRWFRQDPPPVISLAARGSSDHASTFFKYLIETCAGIPTASIGPSVASVYKAPLKLRSAIHFTVSQSGASPDIVALQAAAKAGGARTVAIVNVPDSPIGREADIVIPLGAGPELSVAATKSFIGSAAALAWVAAVASNDAALLKGVRALPETLEKAGSVDVDPLSEMLVSAESLFVCGRGPGVGVAYESALKAKETAGLHAEGFSSAEVMHGPARLVHKGFPVIAYVQKDTAFDLGCQAVEKFEAMGAQTAVFSSEALGSCPVVVPSTGCGLIDPLVSLLPYYRMIEAVTRKLGFDPDKPAHLKKVTETM
ncbi:glucosamine--fructose-6-phosphate aminotransferase (isomerizing) [Cohaesibacter sp. ES.047]|uniref:SIS domain-containing protein n=1 Tax=Cohaesibacter sp. ES.047 TaxID=1798205 RepID=UPI000BB7E3D3|nr:SIS domain-containing protein [Cohaesibacter sp. ES.047]SNY90209.1 glucosamine--fructose-6-phosphate aminotransferase (isomerizing) [Cohaesibacter sp. ES.047]